MDVNKILDGVELDENTKQALTGKLEEFKSEIDNSYGEILAEADSKLKDAIETRDKAKGKYKELEAKITSGDFDGKRELESLTKQLEDEKTKLESENKNVLEKLNKVSQERDAIVSEARETLIQEVPEGLRGTTEDMNLKQLKSFVKGLKEHKVIVDKTKTPNPLTPKKTLAKSFDEWNRKYLGEQNG